MGIFRFDFGFRMFNFGFMKKERAACDSLPWEGQGGVTTFLI